MSDLDLSFEKEIEGFKKGIPKEYPMDLTVCMEILARLKYKCYGFPLVFHCFNPLGGWDVTFRNPAHFSNPEIKAKTPIEACHKMFDFLINLDVNSKPNWKS